MLDIPKNENGQLYFPSDYDFVAATKALMTFCAVPWWVAHDSLEDMAAKGGFTEDELVNELVGRKETHKLIEEMMESGEVTRELSDNFEWEYSLADHSEKY